MGILGVAALLIAPFALPAAAPGAAAESAGIAEFVVAKPVQTLEISSQAALPAASRSDFTATTYAERLRKQYSAGGGSVGGMCGAVVCWPFPYPVRMTDGFGPRVSPCAGCSSNHRGVDLLPGAGTPIYAIADGVVSAYQEGWGYGVHVFIDHVIDGQKVTSLYAHMAPGSVAVGAGMTIKRGEFIGLVGSTGATTAPHLHLEVRVEGTAIDPVPWLRSHTGQG